MNRREFLRGLGAMAICPIPKGAQIDAELTEERKLYRLALKRYEELREKYRLRTLERDQAQKDAEYWFQAYLQESLDSTALAEHLDAEVGFWHEQYEQALDKLRMVKFDRWVWKQETLSWRETHGFSIDSNEDGNLTVEIDGEWTNAPRTIWTEGDEFTDGTVRGTLAEVLNA